MIADYYLSTAAELAVPISDIRPFRAVMMPLDLAPTAASDVDRFIDAGAAARPWIEAARANYRFTMGDALADALDELGLTGAGSASTISASAIVWASRAPKSPTLWPMPMTP